MQIVIDIPKIAYDLLKSDETIDWLDAENILNSIVEGIVLPKGHGRLIDENMIAYTNGVLEDGTAYTFIHPYSIENTPTIIEAVRVESEDEK